jgi:hypothetical protein
VETLTFVLAVVGYAGLTVAVIATTRGPVPHWLWRPTVFVIVTHVLLVWSVRYEWQLSQATRNGYAGFALFHTALAFILLSVFAGEAAARVLMRVAFTIVTVGALGAVFRYDEVAMYRLPIMVMAAVGLVALGRAVLGGGGPAAPRAVPSRRD